MTFAIWHISRHAFELYTSAHLSQCWMSNMKYGCHSLSTLLNEQEKCLELLVNTLKGDCNVKGSDQFTDVLEHVLCGSYQVSYENAETLIKGQDPFILGLLEDVLTTAVPEYTKVIHRNTLLYAYRVDGFMTIVASQNAQMDQPTTYHQLCLKS